MSGSERRETCSGRHKTHDTRGIRHNSLLIPSRYVESVRRSRLQLLDIDSRGLSSGNTCREAVSNNCGIIWSYFHLHWEWIHINDTSLTQSDRYFSIVIASRHGYHC